MPSIAALDRRLRELTGEHRESRPFVCSGSPFGSVVAEVGINPGTKTPFWKFWSGERGFDRQAWLAAYLKKEGRLGQTRLRLEHLRRALDSLPLLELNIYDRYSASEASLAPALRKTAVFDYLLETLRPAVLLVHGDTPAAHLGQLLKTPLKKDSFVVTEYRGRRVEILQAKKHLRLVSYEYVDELAFRIAARAQRSAA